MDAMPDEKLLKRYLGIVESFIYIDGDGIRSEGFVPNTPKRRD